MHMPERMKKSLVYKQEAICQSGYELIRNALISRPTCNQILFLLYLDDNNQRVPEAGFVCLWLSIHVARC